ncbi:hypothetical protein HTT03_13790 [Sulfitobacter sp. S0837]|uniref:hypothetical protein n=1 Tax=Sulfitobacter maritimus TaxID=2741719 RepID=UPI001581B42E|nr:hypothetical protein [Sulfitobacter maritimus]NUH66357.1 hypothetical protein [Sulfitobacter maritimus]
MISALFLTALFAWPVAGVSGLKADHAGAYLFSASDTRERPGSGADITTGTQTGEPGLAFGLNGIKDYSTQQPFIDLMKTSRPWIGHLEGQWGGVDHEELQAMGVLDAQGWPTRIPEGLTGLESFILTDLPVEATHAAGTYHLRYKGAGEIEIFNGMNVRHGEGHITFDHEPNGRGLVGINIRTTDPKGTGNHIRDISVVHEANLQAYAAGEIFNPVWVDLIDDVHALRFMDWMETNDSEVSSWREATAVDNHTYVPGAPVEIMVALANQTGTEPWFTIPYHADDGYIEAFATYVRDTLDPHLRAHYELSNEVWNWQFEQAHQSQAEALERFGKELSDGWVQNYAAKAVEMAARLDAVYAGHETRLIKVISTQTGWLGLEKPILEAPAWQELGNAAPYKSFDTYAITGYFDGALGRDKAKIVHRWIDESRLKAEAAANDQGLAGKARAAWIDAHQYDHATGLAVQELRDGSVTGDSKGSLAHLAELFAYHAAAAEQYGLDLVMYEGGSHVVGVGESLDDEELAAFFQHLNYTDGMGVLYRELLETWVAAGGTLFNAYVDVAGPSKWGSWGALRHLNDTTARYEALMAFNAAYPRSRGADARE